MQKYRVEFLSNSTYQVLEIDYKPEYYPEQVNWNVVFQGNLSDCEAFIRLKENGYL